MISNLPPETELVLLLCRTPVSDEARKRIVALAALPVDWNAVLRHASGWEMEAVVCSNLRGGFGGAIPADVVRLAANSERACRAHTLARTLVTVELALKLEREGIEVVVLKGPAVGVAAYGDPSLRSFADVDLLVKRNDLVAARSVLQALGYTPNYAPGHEQLLINEQHALEFSDSRMMVELHWTLLERHLRFHVNEADLWARSVRVQCAGRSIKVLAPHHLFLFLAAHGAKHEWERLRWICDIAQLAARLKHGEAAEVEDLAKRLHAKRLLALALHLSRDVMGARPSSFSESGLPVDRATGRLADGVIRRSGIFRVAGAPTRDFYSRFEPGLAQLLFWTRTRERLVDRVASLGTVLFVPTVTDQGLNGFRWARRPLRLAARQLRRPPAA